ncbi:MAG: hypothetical protein KC964_18230, partial [Candidatus Omnitrophica bacterium]|nr:hypothetical protein [Candidatus Omnitrophota bacterium]
PDCVEITVDEHVVRMDSSGPSKATCSCSAPASCWHIVLACLKLEDPAVPEIEEAAPSQEDVTLSVEDTPKDPQAQEDEWLAMPEEALRKWAGAEVYRKACKLALNEVDRVQAFEVVFVGEVKCRLVPGGGLEGILSGAPPKIRQVYVIAAVLAYRKTHGLSFDATHPGKESVSGPDLSALEDVQSLLENAIDVGLNHLSLSMLQRMQSLSVQCRAAALVRPSLELESCAKEVEWILDRHARADLPTLFNRMARLYALAESIRNQGEEAPDEYTGAHRAKYEQGESLDLVGVGAHPWETESGFVGVTALFWSPSQEAFFSWSDSRPKHSTGGFKPAMRLDEPSPWTGGGSFGQLARQSFRLENPRMSQERRLSAHSGCRVDQVSSRQNLESLPPAWENWSALRGLHLRRTAIGLRRNPVLDAVIRLRPRKWGKPHFDENEQSLIIPFEDEEGDTFLLLLPYSETTAGAIYFLESFKARPETTSLLGYYRSKPVEHIFPVSLIEEKGALEVTDLLFKSLPPVKRSWLNVIARKVRRFVLLPQLGDIDGPDLLNTEDPLGLFLSPVDDYLLQVAEAGSGILAAGVPPPTVNLAGVGFSRLAERMKDHSTARDLLIARYHYLLILDAV